MLYIHGGNSKQNKLARQIFHFCSESLFSDRENLIIDLYIRKSVMLSLGLIMKVKLNLILKLKIHLKGESLSSLFVMK